MNLQPNLPHNDEEKTIEQPYQMSVARVFNVLSVRDKATLSEYNHDMDHRDVFTNMEVNNKDKENALHRKLFIQKDNYDMRLTGAALCVDTDLKIFWHLLNRKKSEAEISIFDFCEEMELANPRNKNTHKMVIESFYRLSNNIMSIAGENYSATFQLISYKKENETIKYTFNDEFLKLVNSKNGLERHNIDTLKRLRYGVSKLLYTMLVRNKYKKDGSRYFNVNELIEYLGLENKKKSKAKEDIKKSLQELSDEGIIGGFNMKLNDVNIYNDYYMNMNDVENKEVVKAIKEDKTVVKSDSLQLDENGQFINNQIDIDENYDNTSFKDMMQR